MELKLDYVMWFTENIRDILTDKVTILVNKILNDCPIHLTLCLPKLYDSEKMRNYRDAYEEVSIHRFNPESRSFWNSRNLLKYQHYLTSIDMDAKGIFVTQGCIFPGLDKDSDIWDADVVYCCEADLENISATQHSLTEFLADIGYEIDTEEEAAYDFRGCYFSPRCKKALYVKLGEVIEKFQSGDTTNNESAIRYLNDMETNILLTLLISQVREDIPDLTIKSLDMKPCLIDQKLVEHFYSIV
jgi:hypothetical protein